MPAELDHRERFLRSVNYQDIDRIPIFFKAGPEAREMLRARLSLADDESLLNYFDVDAAHIYPSSRPMPGKRPDGEGYFYDIFGSKIRVLKHHNATQHAVEEPVLGDTDDIDAIYAMKWPDSSLVDVEQSREKARAAHETGRAVYGGMWASIFTQSRSIMGEEHFLVSTIACPEFVEKAVERLTDYYLECNEVYFQSCARYLDVFHFGSDFGTQASMFISRDMFVRFFKPQFRRLVSHAKGFGLKVLYHTCGAVSEIIPDLIECGVDVLDPIQVSAANMQPEYLAGKFYGKIGFQGGVSTQRTLPFGTAKEVEQETLRTIETLGPLGYIGSPDQDIIGDVPFENIMTMYRTMHEYRVR